MSHMKQFEHLKIQLDTIKLATNNFANENLIGRGGFGKVYKGELGQSDGKITMVALKRLDRTLGQGESEFRKEIMFLSLYKHKNIVSFLGYCDDHGEKILAYEYASKKSLDLHLNNNELTWVRRLEICIGAAHGLKYLHTPSNTLQRVLHRDIKSANILLDANWNAKIADLGLSKFAPASNQFTYVYSNAVGTQGYCDPPYAETSLLTKESDVYSFGMVLFEVLCGRVSYQARNDTRPPLIVLVHEYYKRNKLSELIYSGIHNEINLASLNVYTKIAYQCLSREREDRPQMTQVVEALENALKYQRREREPQPAPTLSEKVRRAAILNGKVLRTGILIVKVIRTTCVTGSMNPCAASNPYLILKLTKDSLLCRKKSNVKFNEVNPEWNEKFTLYVEDIGSQNLFIYVNNVISAEKHENMGKVKLRLKTLNPEIQETYDLKIEDESYNHIGNLKIETVYMPFTYDEIQANTVETCALPKAPIGIPEGGGLLVIIIHEARLHSEMFQPHASILITFLGETRNTTSMMYTKYPVWEQEFIYKLEKTPTNEILRLEVINNSWMGLIRGKKSMGRVVIRLEDVVNNKRSIETYTVDQNRYLDVELQWRTSD